MSLRPALSKNVSATVLEENSGHQFQPRLTGKFSTDNGQIQGGRALKFTAVIVHHNTWTHTMISDVDERLVENVAVALPATVFLRDSPYHSRSSRAPVSPPPC